MTGPTRSSADLDPRRRKLLFRSWHRGMREMDLLMGRFADAHLAELGDDELRLYEALLEVPDWDLYAWLTEASALPGNYDTPVFHRLKAFHTHPHPIGL